MGDGTWLALRIGSELYGVECTRCEHRAVFVTKNLAARFGAASHTQEYRLLAAMKCKRCGHKGANGRPMDGRRHADAWLNAETLRDLNDLPKRRR